MQSSQLHNDHSFFKIFIDTSNTMNISNKINMQVYIHTFLISANTHLRKSFTNLQKNQSSIFQQKNKRYILVILYLRLLSPEKTNITFSDWYIFKQWWKVGISKKKFSPSVTFEKSIFVVMNDDRGMELISLERANWDVPNMFQTHSKLHSLFIEIAYKFQLHNM